MPRFFVEGIGGDVLRISGEDARHIAFSLRCRPGELLTVCDGRGMDCLCRIVSLDRAEVLLEAVSREASKGEPPVRITLYQAMPKGDKLELIVQKAVELGAAEIVPVITSRCVSRPDGKSMEKKRDRLQKIALEAAKQSGRGIIPAVRPMAGWRQALEELSQEELPILFYEEGREPLGPLLRSRPDRIGIMIGSEGGFSPEEAREAAARGIHLCTMGPRILRCETAPLYALSAITYTYENLEVGKP